MTEITSNIEKTQFSELQQAAMSATFQSFARTFNDAVVFVNKEFSTPPMQGFVRRDFGYVSRSLHMEMTYRRMSGFPEARLDRFLTLVNDKLQKIELALEMDRNRLKELFKQKNEEPEALYARAIRVTVPVIASQANDFLRVMTLADEVLRMSAAASLKGVFDTKQRATLEVKVKKMVRSFTAMVRNESYSLSKELKKLAESGAAGAQSAEMSKLADEHVKDAEETGKAISEEGAADGTLRVPENAGDAVDAMAAATMAAGKRPRKAPAAPADGAATTEGAAAVAAAA
jgi:hypothetical protein